MHTHSLFPHRLIPLYNFSNSSLKRAGRLNPCTLEIPAGNRGRQCNGLVDKSITPPSNHKSAHTLHFQHSPRKFPLITGYCCAIMTLGTRLSCNVGCRLIPHRPLGDGSSPVATLRIHYSQIPSYHIFCLIATVFRDRCLISQDLDRNSNFCQCIEIVS